MSTFDPIYISCDIHMDDLGYSKVSLKQYEKNSRFIKFKCINHGEIFKVPQDMTVYFAMTKPDGQGVLDSQYSITSDGYVLVKVTEQMSIKEGLGKAELRIVDSNGSVFVSKVIIVQIGKSALDNNVVVSQYELDALDELISRAESSISQLNNVVNLTTNQDISGKKTFLDGIDSSSIVMTDSDWSNILKYLNA